MNRPDDADGGVFRRLREHGFNFSLPHKIDFQIDFDEWPPTAEAVALLKREYPNVELIEPEDEYSGYVQFSVFERLTYEFVIGIQVRVSRLLESYGGTCECWGVLSDGPPKPIQP